MAVYTGGMENLKQSGGKSASSFSQYLGQDCCQQPPKKGGIRKYCEWWVILIAVVVVVLIAGGSVFLWLFL